LTPVAFLALSQLPQRDYQTTLFINMPEYYDDWWWEDLPPRAVKAAEILGYNKSMWDDDEESEYESKKFEDCTLQERHAAMFLGANPIDEKLDIYWEDTDSETKRHAQALGWDQQ
jgi:hypothetical protein